MHEVLVNRLGGLSLPRKSVVRLTDRPDMTLDVYRGCKTTMQQQLLTHTRKLIAGWMDGRLAILSPFLQYFSHIRDSFVQWNPIYDWKDFHLQQVLNLGPSDQQATAKATELPSLLQERGGSPGSSVAYWSSSPRFEPCLRPNLLNHKWGSIAHGLSLSDTHCPDMTEILLKRM